MDYKLPLRYIPLAVAVSFVSVTAQAELQELGEEEMRSVTGGSALQYSATDISYDLKQLIGVDYSSGTREEVYTDTEHVDATVHRVQINGSGELHAYAEKFILGDYSGNNYSVYRTSGEGHHGGVPENDLAEFGFGNSADEPFYFEDPYIEVQKQGDKIRGIRIGFGKAEGHTPLTINSTSGYISTLSLLSDLPGDGLVKAQVYGTGTKDTFVSLLGEMPNGSGNYPVTGADAGANTTGRLAPPALVTDVLGGVLDLPEWLLQPILDTIGLGDLLDTLGVTGLTDIANRLNDDLAQQPGGKELNLDTVRSLDFHNVQNFYISLTQGGGNSFVNEDGSINGAKWSQHLSGVIPENRPDLPGSNMVMPFNDRTDPNAGYVEAHVDMAPALAQILLGVGDDNPAQNYQPAF